MAKRKAPRRDVSTVADIAVLAARIGLLEQALAAVSADVDDLRVDGSVFASLVSSDVIALEDKVATLDTDLDGVVRDVNANGNTINAWAEKTAAKIDDLRGRLDELEGVTDACCFVQAAKIATKSKQPAA